MNHGPIFVAGADRSGTTLTSAILASHPNIAIAPLGSNMWTFFYGQYGDLAESGNFERCLAALLQYKNVLRLNPNPERIRAEFWQGEPSYSRLFRLFQDHYAEQVGRPRWGDKTSYIERYADPIFGAYPDAKIIHLVRDPRDRYASAIKRWPNSRGRVGGATARWLFSVQLANENKQQYPDRCIVVRYETLVSQPEETVRKMCAFLDEDFDPCMLTMAGAEAFYDKGGNSSFVRHSKGAISTASIGRFREVLSKQEIAFIQSYAKQRMVALNYELDPIQLSATDRLAFYLSHWPVNRARMLAWRTLEAIQRNYPTLAGRNPHRKRIVMKRGNRA